MTEPPNKLGVAREYAASFWDKFNTPSHAEFAKAIRNGEKDQCEAVQIAMMVLLGGALTGQLENENQKRP